MIFHQYIRAYPFLFGYCDTEREWKRFLRGRDTTNCESWPGVGNSALAFLTRNTYEGWMMVLLSEKAMRLPLHEVVGILAHECRHAVDRLNEAIQEHNPGLEATAYLTGWMMELCTDQYLRSMRQRGWRVKLNGGL